MNIVRDGINKYHHSELIGEMRIRNGQKHVIGSVNK